MSLPAGLTELGVPGGACAPLLFWGVGGDEPKFFLNFAT